VNAPCISVVVPFYNNGDVLNECLQSIGAQTHRNLQVIMVDDGSTDCGSGIARKWAAADPRFSLVQTPNGGPGKARNVGVEHATGEYLAFVDGDDMLAPYAYEVLLHTLESSGYLQTWHGTPLKRIGFDIERPQFASGTAYLDHLAEEVRKWDLLLSQNAFSTPIFRRSFRFGGEICEHGYPRNDILARGGGERAAEVRRRLGIPAGKRVVLYAPTWRDNQFYASGRYRGRWCSSPTTWKPTGTRVAASASTSSRGPGPPAGHVGRGHRRAAGHHFGAGRLPGRLPGVRRQVLSPGRRQSRRPRLRAPVHELAGRAGTG
jgi:glycosyltransferase involved in cell wall biosynthesis